jgi:hypothetical protein
MAEVMFILTVCSYACMVLTCDDKMLSVFSNESLGAGETDQILVPVVLPNVAMVSELTATVPPKPTQWIKARVVLEH